MIPASAPAHVVVLGAGVNGLSTALELLRDGFTVEVVSKERPHETTSAVAAAACNLVSFKMGSSDRSARWCHESFAHYLQLASDTPEAGIRLRLGRQRMRGTFVDKWWEEAPNHRFVARETAYETHEFSLPIVDMPVYLGWLAQQISDLGGVFTWAEVASWQDLEDRADVIVNAAGVGAGQLTGDTDLHPVRGQSVEIVCDEIQEFIDDDSSPAGLTLLYPRTRTVALGGTMENSWSRNPDAATTSDIIRRCAELDPRVLAGEVVNVAVGLRPARSAVRLEVDHGSARRPIVHNYGHGGNGVKMSWGCAREVVGLCQGLAGPP